jgi:hypothetical protein
MPSFKTFFKSIRSVINERWNWQAFPLLTLIFQKVRIMIRKAQYQRQSPNQSPEQEQLKLELSPEFPPRNNLESIKRTEGNDAQTQTKRERGKKKREPLLPNTIKTISLGCHKTSSRVTHIPVTKTKHTGAFR